MAVAAEAADLDQIQIRVERKNPVNSSEITWFHSWRQIVVVGVQTDQENGRITNFDGFDSTLKYCKKTILGILFCNSGDITAL